MLDHEIGAYKLFPPPQAPAPPQTSSQYLRCNLEFLKSYHLKEVEKKLSHLFIVSSRNGISSILTPATTLSEVNAVNNETYDVCIEAVGALISPFLTRSICSFHSCSVVLLYQ
ncbi:UNVERIFIED_CONTAM: hypothetical protein O8I53_13860 [Campylobacter lari]